MQTFLPYPDFEESAASLDDRRLGKQRVEALQIYRALHRESYGWQHHPCVRMWRGHAKALICYAAAICAEWTGRGFKDTVLATLLEESAREVPPTQAALEAQGASPPWLGDDRLHASHRAALVRKDPGRYRELFPDADPSLPYFWPVRPTHRADP